MTQATSTAIRILHLEDDPADARLIREHLRKSGLESVVTLVDRRETFETELQNSDFDIILADFSLPAFSGLEALELSRSRCPGKSFIFVTGAVGEERAVDLLRSGATDFVWKDRLSRLAPVVRRAVAEGKERVRREQAENALRENEARFKLAQARGGIGVFEWEICRGVTYWSETMWSLYGLNPVPVAAIPRNWLKRIASEDRHRILQHIRQFLASHQTEFRDEFRVRWPDGRQLWIEAIAQVDRNSSGQPIRMLGVNLDISIRKQSELALREADRRKDEFLATLAHELRNPLAPIRNSLNVLRMTGNVTPVTERIYEVMERQVSHMVRLVDDLLEVSRISRGTIVLQKEVLEVATGVRSALDTSQPLIDAAGHTLNLALPSQPIYVQADPVRFSQIVANLLNNAAKYTNSGGQIKLVVEPCQHEVVISVRDNGIGIPSQMMPNIFQMFTQVDRDHKRAQGGLGIGLALVKSLVEMHGGQVYATSDGPGKGSIFTVRLPVVDGSSAAVDDVEQACTRTAPRARILVVDDNEDAAVSLGMLLKMQGSDVEVLTDGVSALDALPTYRPSIVLLDLGMPGLSGYEVARRIREQRQFDGITLVAVSGWGQDEDRNRTREAGFQYHLVKPVDLAALQSLLSTIESQVSCLVAERDLRHA